MRTTCPYCGVGCQHNLQIKNNKIVKVIPSPDGPVNHGQACVKGKFGLEFVHDPGRLTSPLIKKDGQFTEATWDEALGLIAENLKSYSSDQVAVISSVKCTSEDNYVIQKFARSILGTNTIDLGTHLLPASTAAGLASTFGNEAMTNSINEIGDASCILSIGSNISISHPIVGLEIKRAVDRGAKLILANPREIDLCHSSHLWLQHKPRSEVALLMGMMRVIVDENLLDKPFVEERCENFDEFLESLKTFDLDTVEKITGVPKDKISEAARIYATQKPSSILCAIDTIQQTNGNDNAIALADLAMLTGNIGKPSTGVNLLRDQNNVQGACDMGALPNFYPGYQAVTDPDSQNKFEEAWNVSLNPKVGLTLREMFPAAHQGQIKAMYLVGANPLLGDSDSKPIREALEKLEFLVVQDIFLTETAQMADVVLPASSFAEKDGTFTNTERRVQRVRQAIEPTGESKPGWWITCQIARRMGGNGFDFEHPSDIMKEISSLTPSYGGISYERLDRESLQWPCPTSDHTGTPFLYRNSFDRGKGKLIPLQYKPPAEMPDDNYPLILNTEHINPHFCPSTMTLKVKGLRKLQDEEFVEINPADAENLGITDQEPVKVISRLGEVTAKAKITAVSPPGVVSMSSHFAESPTEVAAIRVEKLLRIEGI